MAAKPVSVAAYIWVLVILWVLTIVTVAISFVPLPPAGHVAAGLTIGAIKAAFVVLIFMHALYSPRITWCVIIAAITWVLILFSLTYTDYLTRGKLPQLPGH